MILPQVFCHSEEDRKQMVFDSNVSFCTFLSTPHALQMNETPFLEPLSLEVYTDLNQFSEGGVL